MRKNMFRKGLVLGIIVLFVGASVVPIIRGDDEYPSQSIEFGTPFIMREWRGNDCYVIGPYTPVWINSSDMYPGTERIEYSVWVADDPEENPIVWTEIWNAIVYDGDDDDLDETFGNIVTEFYLDETCFHEVRYQCWDYDGVTEGQFSEDFFVDKCPPDTTKVVGVPTCNDGWPPPPWINGLTSLNFNSVDDCCLPDGTIVEKITIKVWWKSNPYDSSGALFLIDTIIVEDGDDNDINPAEGKVGYELHLEETGFYELEYWGVDMMGNKESHQKQQYRVDIVPPEIIKTVGEPSYQLPGSDDYYVTTGTEITLEANDFGCGYYGAVMIVYKIKYDDQWTEWDPYTGPLYFNQEGEYILAVRAFDCLGNSYDEQDWDIETFYVYDTLPTIIDDVWLNVPFFSQLDPLWKNKTYDHISSTIGLEGCALTCAAMISKYYGYETNPDLLNTALIEIEDGYVNQGNLNWLKLDEVTDNKVEFKGMVDGGFNKIYEELSNGYPVIAKVCSPVDHFIIFIGKIGDNYYFYDPAHDPEETSTRIYNWPDGTHGEYVLCDTTPLRIIHGTPANMEVADLDSPGELCAYDSSGRKTGIISGEIFENIPNSFYNSFTESVTIYYPEDSYYYRVVGSEEDYYNLTIYSFENGDVINFSSFNIPIIENAVHEYIVDWSLLKDGSDGVSLKVDNNYDGLFEETLFSDWILTQSEFILQTQTIIDIDPDTLNLNSKGKWITCYIELPEGYDLSDINISTILLNDTVPAETHPTNISDYDEDGIPDLMVKFDRQDVQDILEIGDNVAITITGKLFDETQFEGTDYIKVI